MRLKVSFTNGVPPVDFTANSIQATPLELLVSATGSPHSRTQALQAYIRSLDYLFRGVSNVVSTDIEGISVEKGWFGKMEKHRDAVEWSAVVDKSFVVVYDVSLKSITENMYVADSIAVGAKKSSQGVTPIWLKELLQPTNTIATQNLQNAVALFTEFVDRYRFVWGLDGRSGLTLLDANSKPIKLTDIKEDEVYILGQLINLLSGKGVHMGVFLIDCTGFTDRILGAFVEMAKAYFGDTLLFLYNVDHDSKVERVKVSLPNFVSLGCK